MAGNKAVHEFKIEVEHTGLGIAKAEIKGSKTLGLSVEGQKQDWTTIQSGGWGNNLITGKTATVTLDVVTDYTNALHKELIEKVVFGDAQNHNGFTFTITFPKSVETATTAATLEFEGSLNPSDVIGGESTDVSAMKLEISLNGKPTYTAETV